MHSAHARNLRVGRRSLSGHPYLVTTVTHGRRPLFGNLILARLVVRAMHYHDRQGELATLAYVVMPDHAHWLFQLREGSLASVMRRFKSYSARAVNQHCGQVGTVWQAGFHDHGVREDEDLRVMARYVVANPVRAGLVARVGDYPHWDAIWMPGDADVP